KTFVPDGEPEGLRRRRHGARRGPRRDRRVRGPRGCAGHPRLPGSVRPMAAQVLPLAMFAVLMPWAIYRRVRMNIGRQRLSARRLTIRASILATLLAVIAWPAFSQLQADTLAAFAAGAAIGVGVGFLALRHTRFETGDGIE